MGYAKISRDSAFITDTTKTISYTLYNGNNQSITVDNVDYAEMLLDDISDLLEAVNISNTVDKTTNRITIDDWGIDFLVSVYKSSGYYYPKIYQDGDYSKDYPPGGQGSICKLNGFNNRFKYDLYIYSNDDGFSIEIADGANVKYALTNMVTVQHPYNSNKKVLMISCYFPQNQGQASSQANMFKDMDDLTHCIMPLMSSNTTVYPIMETKNYVGTIFPDTSEMNNVNIKKLVWFDHFEIPGYYQLPATVVSHGTDFNDGTYKYHVLRMFDTSTSPIRVAIRYGTVA